MELSFFVLDLADCTKCHLLIQIDLFNNYLTLKERINRRKGELVDLTVFVKFVGGVILVNFNF